MGKDNGPSVSRDELLITLWPSPHEIQLNDPPNEYLAGLDGFYSSLGHLEEDLCTNGVRVRWYTNICAEKGNYGIARLHPPMLAEFIVALSASGLAIGLYRTLKLWVEKINGRKWKIKIDNIEVEATQLNTKEFIDLLEKAVEYQQRLTNCLLTDHDIEAQLGAALRGLSDEDKRALRELRSRFYESWLSTRRNAKVEDENDSPEDRPTP